MLKVLICLVDTRKLRTFVVMKVMNKKHPITIQVIGCRLFFIISLLFQLFL